MRAIDTGHRSILSWISSLVLPASERVSFRRTKSSPVVLNRFSGRVSSLLGFARRYLCFLANGEDIVDSDRDNQMAIFGRIGAFDSPKVDSKIFVFCFFVMWEKELKVASLLEWVKPEILFRLVQDTVVDFIATKGVSISAVAGSVDECFANLRDGWVESRRGVEKLSKRVFRSWVLYDKFLRKSLPVSCSKDVWRETCCRWV